MPFSGELNSMKNGAYQFKLMIAFKSYGWKTEFTSTTITVTMGNIVGKWSNKCKTWNVHSHDHGHE